MVFKDYKRQVDVHATKIIRLGQPPTNQFTLES